MRAFKIVLVLGALVNLLAAIFGIGVESWQRLFGLGVAVYLTTMVWFIHKQRYAGYVLGWVFFGGIAFTYLGSGIWQLITSNGQFEREVALMYVASGLIFGWGSGWWWARQRSEFYGS